MKNFYFLALLAFVSLSCESDSADTVSEQERTAAISGHNLRITNQSDLDITGELYCFGSDDNLTVNPSIRIMGKISIPANSDVTHKNFSQSSNPEMRINPWYVSYNSGPAFVYPAAQTNNTFGQLLAPGSSPVKFANWRYLKLRFTYNQIPGFEPIKMVVELPQFSDNNSGGHLVDLSPYGLEEDLYISQSSYQTANGNTVLTINSELVN